jgi:hypothetical protein
VLRELQRQSRVHVVVPKHALACDSPP